MRKFTDSKITAKVAIGTAIFTILTSLVLGQYTLAADTKPDDPNPPPMSPTVWHCYAISSAPSSGPGSETFKWTKFYDCMQHYEEYTLEWRERVNDWWYRRSEKMLQSTENKIIIAGVGSAMDAIAYMTTNFAYDAANWILGADSPDGRPTFWEGNFGDYLTHHADQASGVFFERFDSMHQFSADFGSGDQTEFGFGTLCKKPSPLDIRLGLGLPGIGPMSPGTCTLSAMVDNFESIGDMVSSQEALTMHREAFNPHGNDFHVGLELHSNYIDAILGERNSAKLTRQETEGMVPILDKVTQKIEYPSMLANESLRNIDPVAMALVSKKQREDYMIQTFLETGISGITILTIQTFASRLALGLLDKIFNPEEGVDGASTGDTQKYNIIYQNLTNEDATGDMQNFYERQAFAKSIGDFIISSYYSQKDQDLITQLSTCSQIRGKWNCAMDQNLAIAIGMGTTDGALTIGKAAGIGNENATVNPNAIGLHADWELIPESDIANNTDPSCYQRAYCAGNLKKLRLARILPIGFEMAANSPYNVKHKGSYVTLGEVIRGFYDCNEDGELDKDHPWCHLIDPNWILAAPKYQCRAEGYGDALMPELGTRQEECGDMVTCLGTDQAGECDRGYGYCLAERPVYKFDAPECDAHNASCRTYVSSKGKDLSALRYTVERGACSQENIGCMWYSTLRYTPTPDTTDGLWVGTLNDGPRVYFDGGAEPCAAAGCTKVLNVEVGEPALNLVRNGSLEDVVETQQNGERVLQEISGWDSTNAVYTNIESTEDSYDGSRSLTLESAANDQFIQTLKLYPNRNYTLSFYFKSKENYGTTSGHVNIDFFNDDETISANRITDEPANFEDCYWDSANSRLTFNEAPGDGEWHRKVCQFVSPEDVGVARVYLNLADFLYLDAIQLEEGEFVTEFIDEPADLEESYIQIAPDEYVCTGNDDEDNPACGSYARLCRQTEVGCQGYNSVNDPTAPEIPATLTSKDYCPSACSGYGEYRKLASSFDLVENLVHPEFSDPTDDGRTYLIPKQATACTLQQVGCEPFTNMEAAQEGGETIAYYDELRSCQTPNELSRTYFTWEGSDEEGYVLRTWALIAESDTSNKPDVMLKGAEFGDIKDPDSCDEALWSSGADQDCRQFYDEAGDVYYAYYSQTISSDGDCTLYRKDDSSQVDCEMTGGHEYLPEAQACLYYALPSESYICSASAGGCRAYLGPTGRNAVQTYFQSFADDGSEVGFSSNSGAVITRSEESVLVGDYSLRVESNGGSDIQTQVDIPLITTSSLYRVSFWAKSQDTGEVTVSIDGQSIGTVRPSIIWQRFELGPFEVQDTTSTLSFTGPSSIGSLFIDTIKLDQLNDVRFLVKNSWTIPAACDATAEGTPEPRAMLGCAEYMDRDGNQIFAKNFSNLCRADSIGCKAFIDTRSVSNPYPETRNITGTPGPSPRKDADAKAYEEQYLGDWSVTSPAWRYYYAIDDVRARCDESQDSCRAFGKPIFTQDRLSLEPTDVTIDPNNPANTEILQNQDIIYEFDTVTLKHDWDAYYNDDESLNLACRKDELHCEKYQSGNVTEYFRDPGNHTCEWRDAKELSANPEVGIYTDGTYGGWFRSGTDIPCYPGNDQQNTAPYLKDGTNFGAYFTGEDQYTGWVSKCPVDQSECTEFVDPNDTSDAKNSTGRSYYLINSRQIDVSSCGGMAEPLAGCVLFNNKNIPSLYANSKASYDLVNAERGAPQNPIDCEADPGNPHCKYCSNYVIKSPTFPQQQLTAEEIVSIIKSTAVNEYETQKYATELIKYENQNNSCNTDADCIREGVALFPSSMPNKPQVDGFVVGTCGRSNDSNVVLKVKLDRECARWMGCKTGETVYDPAQQKYVNQCSELQLCEDNGSANDDIYCSDFTDRNIEELLTPAQFVSMEAYSSREVGYGHMDYSGYTIPNQYLLPDIQTRAVGSDILTGDSALRYKQNKRLVAGLPITSGGPISVMDPDPAYPNLDLCRDTRTNRIGYVLNNDTCYLAINEPQALSFVAGGSQGNNLSRDITAIYKYFNQGNTGSDNSLLQNALPSPECQLYPEQTSPLPNSYVAKWNEQSVPPTPLEMAQGFEAAKACVYGEGCSCSYRKVRYQTGAEQYYAVDGRAPAIGICIGGDNDGGACVPGGFVPVSASDKVIANAAQQFGPQEASQCGGTGMCASIQDVVIHNGMYGYCLERDRTRTDGISQDSAPCLTWSPIAVVGGGNEDLRHYAPSAGYIAPQGSGEYYCMSGANEQTLSTPSTEMKDYNNSLSIRYNEHWWMPGDLWQFNFARNEVWWSAQNEGANVAIDGVDNISFIDRTSEEVLEKLIIKKDEDGEPIPGQKTVPSNQTKNMRFACRRVTTCEGRPNANDTFDFNDKEGRWIMTGDSLTNSYMEYFIPSGPGINWTDEDYYDYNYGLFRFSLMPYAAGTACKWNPKWVDMDYPTVDQSENQSFSCQAYLEQTQQNSQQFISQFRQKFPGVLDRSSEEILRDDQGTPVRMECAIGADESCYYKFWETGYQNDNQEQFRWPFTIFQNKLEQFNFKEQYKTYYAHECNAGSPYFGIRAVFQNVNKRDNRLQPDEAKNMGFEGPWQFIGFWFTTCLPTERRADPGWLYMRMDTVTADVCKEVGQVIAPESRENAAFMDRIWSRGNFLLPVLGLNYDSRNEPYGAALATSEIGSDPMLLGASVPTSGALNKAPGFIDSGLTTAAILSQQNSWVPLTNLFARVYKVYRWDPNAVESGDWTCVKGSQKGKPCPEYANNYDGLKVCGEYATCDPDVSVDIKNQNWRCNALSGVNRGLHCGDDPYPARNTDPICHNAALAWSWNEVKVKEETVPLYSACESEKDRFDYYIPTSRFGMCDSGPNGEGENLVPQTINWNTYCDDWFIWGGEENAPTYDRDENDSIRLRFSRRECPDGYYIADPIAPDKPNTAGKGYTYATPLLLVYGLLEMEVDDSNCEKDINGNLIDRLQKLIDDSDKLQRYKQEVESYVDYSGWGSEYNTDTHIVEQLKKIKLLWEQDITSFQSLQYGAPINYQLGRWLPDTAALFSDFNCADDSVRAGLKCGTPGETSKDCPMRIDPCGSGGYYTKDYLGTEVPACGYCNQDSNHKYNANYPHNDNTGFCQGFNPMARCHDNSDCVFTDYEHWGAFDEGGASGKDWNRARKDVYLLFSNELQDEKDLVIAPRNIQPPTVKLPMPLVKTDEWGEPGYPNKLPDQLQEPAMLTNFNNHDWKKENYHTYNLNCGTEVWESMCQTIFDNVDPEEAFTTWDYLNTQDDVINVYDDVYGWKDTGVLPGLETKYLKPGTKGYLYQKCMRSCEGSALLAPNAYADYYNKINDKEQPTKQRMAAVAPFSVNPLTQILYSLGFQGKAWAKEGIYDTFSVFFVKGLLSKTYYENNRDEYSIMELAKNKPIIHLKLGGELYSYQHFIDAMDAISDNFVDRIDSTHENNQVYSINSQFPWDPEKIRFTTIFPLVNEAYGQGEWLDPWEKYFWKQAVKIWPGFGISLDLIDKLDAIVSDTIEPNSEAYKAFAQQVKVDMTENYYDKTGWGTFMNPNWPGDVRALSLYPGAMPAAVPRQDTVDPDADNSYVFIPGHCEPPPGGTDSDSIEGELLSLNPAGIWSEYTSDRKKMLKFLQPGRVWPLHHWYGTSNDVNSQTFSFIHPWESEEQIYSNWGTEGLYPEDEHDKYFMTNAEIERHKWWQPTVQSKIGVDSSSISLEGPINPNDPDTTLGMRSTCRCVGGKRNGTVQESEADCNLGLPDSMNPEKMADPWGFPSEYCKANANYIDNEWVPIPECQALTGVPNHEDPDLDDNMCTHRAGYIPRGDVCADGRDDCLVTYNVSDPISTDHVNKSDDELAAPSATDVTSGLDTYWYISGGKVQRLNREYSAWYRPRPPRIAAPDMTRSGASSNAQPISSVDAFSIDGLPSGLVYYGSGQGLVTIRFYAWAMHNQGPLDTIIIDWGDGTIQEITDAQMKNAKPVCNTDKECEFIPGLACGSDADCPPGTGACMAIGNCKKQAYKTCREDIDCGNDDSCEQRVFFGNSTEACRQGYFEFKHVYTCDKNTAIINSSCGTAGRCSLNPDITCNVDTDCPRDDEECLPGLAPTEGCYIEELDRCRFTPRVQVRDSWGWCTGDCSRDNELYPGGPVIDSSNKELLTRHPYGGCYDGSQTKINEEVMDWVGGATPDTLINECSFDEANDILRPWVVFNGAVELKNKDRVGQSAESGGGVGGFNIQPSGTGGIGGLSPTP